MTSDPHASGHGRTAFGLASAGVLAALALVPAAFLAPLYSGETVTSTGEVTTSSGTLVTVNGFSVLLPISIPPLLALAAWLGLQRRCTSGSSAGTIIAWTAASLLALASILAFSIGLLILPATILIILATALTPRGQRRRG